MCWKESRYSTTYTDFPVNYIIWLFISLLKKSKPTTCSHHLQCSSSIIWQVIISTPGRNLLCSLVFINLGHIKGFYCPTMVLQLNLVHFTENTFKCLFFFIIWYLHNFKTYKYLANALVKMAPPPCIANQDWTNIPTVFIAGHRGHSNWKTRL